MPYWSASSASSVTVRDVCILRLSALGDVCNLVPAVRALQRAVPGICITWILGRAEYNLLAGLDGVNFHVYDKKSGLAGMLRLRRELLQAREGKPFEVLLHMQAALRASLLSRFIPACRRVGFDAERAKDKQHWFVNEQLPPHPRCHVGEGFLDFVHYLGVAQLSPLEWRLPIPMAAEQEAARWSVPHAPYLLLSPCSSNRARNWRNWSAEGYARLVDHAHAVHGLTTLVTGGNSAVEKDMVAHITRLSKAPVINAVGQTSLKVLLALIRDARLVVAPDSGPIHLAVAMGTPPLGLYVTSNPQRTGPWQMQDWVVNRYPDAVQLFLGKTVDAVRWGQRVRDPAAIDLIRVEDVIARLDAIMASKESFQ